MTEWTPESVLVLVQGLWDIGAWAVGAAVGCWFWYSACRYGWPWASKSRLPP